MFCVPDEEMELRVEAADGFSLPKNCVSAEASEIDWLDGVCRDPLDILCVVGKVVVYSIFMYCIFLVTTESKSNAKPLMKILCWSRSFFWNHRAWLFSRTRHRGPFIFFFVPSESEFALSSWRACRGWCGAWTRSSRMRPRGRNFCGSQAPQKWLCCRWRKSTIPSTRGNTIRTSMIMTAARHPCWRLIRKRCSSCARGKSWACWPGSSLVETKKPFFITRKLQRSFMLNTRRWPSHLTRRSSSGWSAASRWR